MATTPILHFNGRFRFHMPEYNNNPANPGVAFDPARTPEQVMALCGCDPGRYYEFEFVDVEISQATLATGEAVTAGEPLVGRRLDLRGMLPDVSPSAIGAQLFGGRLALEGVVDGKVRTAFQSDLRLEIRPLGFTDESAAAHFTTIVDVGQWQDPGSSAAAAALSDARELELHFNLGRYTRLDNPIAGDDARLTGDVYGYLCPAPRPPAPGARRMRGRRLVRHPQLAQAADLEQVFLLETGTTPLMRISDIDGTYDVLADEGLVALHNLHYTPFLDRDHTTPTSAGIVKEYVVALGPHELGRYRGDREELQRTGGLLVFALPDGVAADNDLTLSVSAVKPDDSVHPLMLESEFDIVLESDRCVTLGSRGSADVVARVYRRQLPAAGHRVMLRTQPQNRRSPIVAAVASSQVTTDQDGVARASIQAIDLLATGGVFDPVVQQPLEALPRDRYFGNYAYLAIANPMRPVQPAVEEVEIAVRVVHAVGEPPATPSFARDVLPLFTYYLRYFPWLHTRRSGAGYRRFLDLGDYDSVSDRAQEIIRRLELADDDPAKMPRSRDFPHGGVELIKRWFESGMAE